MVQTLVSKSSPKVSILYAVLIQLRPEGDHAQEGIFSVFEIKTGPKVHVSKMVTPEKNFCSIFELLKYALLVWL